MTQPTENSTPDQEQDTVTAALLVIGDEILSGRTNDKNINRLATHCTDIGIRLSEVRVVSDDSQAIIAALNELRASYSYVFTTGGIGPTHDDITAQSVADAFQLPLLEDPEALAILEDHYPDGALTDARRLMARVPKGGQLVQNSISAAPGFMIENVIVMAGVPSIVEVMLDDVTPKLRTGKKLLSKTVQVHHPESFVATLLLELQNQYEGISIGSYPYFRDGVVGTTIVMRSVDEEALSKANQSLQDKLKELDMRFS